MLGLGASTVAHHCGRGHFDAHRMSRRVGGCTWLLRLDLVEAEAARRKEVRQLKEQGRKRCPTCKEKKPRKEFWKGQGECIECQKDRRKSPYREVGHKPDYGTGERLSGGVKDYVGHLKPAAPADALRYACMDVGYHHRPIPRGQSKRKAFCTKCTAKRCMFHRELTPKELVEQWKKWGR